MPHFGMAVDRNYSVKTLIFSIRTLTIWAFFNADILFFLY